MDEHKGVPSWLAIVLFVVITGLALVSMRRPQLALPRAAPAPAAPSKSRLYSRYDIHNIYDPTNGTVSPGNIVRFPGGYTAPE